VVKRLLRVGLREYEVVDCFDPRHPPAVKQFFNTTSALHFLQNFQDDYFGMVSLRDIAAERHHCLDPTNLNDRRILQLIAGDLAAGRLKIIDKQRREIPIGGAKEVEATEEEAPAAATAIPVEPPAETKDPEPPCPQALTLKEAAMDGTPFCEKCEGAKKVA
jgi:hypothetical protein